MAASALVVTADGEVSFAQRSRLDALLDSVEALKAHDAHDAADLFRMYTRFAELQKWKIDVLNSNPTGVGGYKEIICSIDGDGAYSRLKFEGGVHRVQRVPATEASGRIHTSAVTVAVQGKSPISASMATDLPDPDSPTIATTSPPSTSKSTPSTARN